MTEKKQNPPKNAKPGKKENPERKIKETAGKKTKKPGVPFPVLAKRILPALLILLVLLISALAFTVIRIAGDPAVPYGVRVESRDAGGLEPDELDAFLESNWPDPKGDETISLYADGFQMEMTYKELGVTLDRESVEERLLAAGHTGWAGQRVADRLIALKNGRTLDVPVRFDRDKLDSQLQAANNALHKEATGARLLVGENRVSIVTGHDGVRVDTHLLAGQIVGLINNREPGRILVPTIPIRSPKLEPAPILKAINVMARDAEKGTDEAGNAIVIPSITGRQIEADILAEELGKLDNRTDRGEVEHVLPVQFKEPDVKTEDLSVSSGTRIGGLFETRLPRATETDKNRAHNVDLAIRALDGLTIPPGASFSFNEATGPRTAEAGYVDAPVYADGRITMGLGGGICQLSTTACNAMLEAGLEPLERHAHMFMVGYTSPGRDASVAYGIQDLRFANPYSHPVTIRASLKGESLKVSVLVAEKEVVPSIRLYTRTLSVEPANVTKVPDSTLPSGSQITVAPGMDGLTVETWLQRYIGGNLQQEAKLFDSRYLPYPALIHIGSAAPIPQV